MSVSECLLWLWLLYTYIIPAENMSSWVMEYQFQTSKGYVSRNCLICQQNKTILNKNTFRLDSRRTAICCFTFERIFSNESSLAPRCGFRQQVGPRIKKNAVVLEEYLATVFLFANYFLKNRQIEYSTFNTLWNMHKISRECFFSSKVYCFLNHDAPYLDQV